MARQLYQSVFRASRFVRRPGAFEIPLDAALLAAAVLAYLFRYLLPQYTLLSAYAFSDLAKLSFPIYSFTGHSIVEGTLPLWNPYMFAGFPHFAMPESACFYPFTWLYGLGPFETIVELDVVFHIWLFVFATYLLGRDLFEHRLPALFLALLIMASIFTGTMLQTGQLWAIHAHALMPLAFLTLRRILATGNRKWLLAFSSILALQVFTGFLQGVTYILLALGLYTAGELTLRLIFAKEPWPAVVRKGLLCLLGVALGLGLASPQILATRELLENSLRGAGVTQQYFYGIYLPRTWYLDRFVYQRGELAGNFGPLVVALAVVGLALHAKRERFAFLCALAGCLVYMKLPDWLYLHVIQHIDFLSNTRGVSRMGPVANYLVYVAAGYGVAVLTSSAENRKRKHSGTLAFAILGSAAITAALLTSAQVNWIAFALMMASVALAWLSLYRIPAISALTVLSLSLLVGERIFVYYSAQRLGSPTNVRLDEDFTTFSGVNNGLGRTALFRRGIFDFSLLQNAGVLTGERIVGGYHALMLLPYVQFMERLTGAEIAEWDEDGRLASQTTMFPMGNWVTPDSLRGLDLMNVRYLVASQVHLPAVRQRSNRVPRARPPGVDDWRFKYTRIGELDVYQNTRAMDPVTIYHHAEAHPDEPAILSRLADKNFPYSDVACVTASELPEKVRPATGHESAQITHYGLHEVVIEASLTAPGLVVLHDVMYPGWDIFVGGTPAEIITTNTLFRGVFVPTGSHTIRFVYTPTWLTRALLIFAPAALVWAAIAISPFVRSRRRRGS